MTALTTPGPGTLRIDSGELIRLARDLDTAAEGVALDHRIIVGHEGAIGQPAVAEEFAAVSELQIDRSRTCAEGLRSLSRFASDVAATVIEQDAALAGAAR